MAAPIHFAAPVVSESSIDEPAIRDICRRFPIRRLALFGSVLRQDFHDASDVDVLVKWNPDAVVGFRVFELERELSEVLGNRRIDLVNEKYLNARLRERIIGSARVVYAEG